ncbi:helix-turn-helix domain-containing protein [Sinirhodobacter populi]|uniref:Helix-turn-helix domain-containing protein n=1 Tax=Paenirhodobacter populi TaxID=2306993 RepID=A0A443K253_9RHOB|nr:helix-turn-helix domain-containing protein [Sinirhodobacter populi]RWR26825.1 helix-turn-helix domain-containing protein [Sinirhodobacter populi]
MKADPRPPAHVAHYVEALGRDRAIRFLLEFGGAELYIATAPKGRSRLSEVIGLDGAAALAGIAHLLPKRVPTAKPWIAQCLRVDGLNVAAIARLLHVSDVSVRKWLKRLPAGTFEDPRQMRLL